MLNYRSDLRSKLFYMGFYATTDRKSKQEDYPFYGNWNSYIADDLNIYVHPKQSFYKLETERVTICLIGHIYDPLNNIGDEMTILDRLAKSDNEDKFFDYVCKLTGIYTLLWKYDDWFLISDACGIQTAFYTQQGEHLYISSHDSLLGDILGLRRDDYVEHLVNYRFFHLFGASLPGDLSQFSDVKRVIPNHCVRLGKDITISRFHLPKAKDVPYEQIVEEAARILNNSLKLIAQKWNTPAISTTGGCDSKTTLACARGAYDKFKYFSYVSSDSEYADAVAAHKICEKIVPESEHIIYEISNEDDSYNDLELHRRLLMHNQGELCKNNPNDVRKRCHFNQINDFDVEVKSWSSEIGRAYYSKRFNNRRNFPKNPTPRACTTLYKVFLHDRGLVRQTDKVFEQYLSKYYVKSDSIPWQDQFFWEFRVSSWNGLVITGEHRYSFDITIPYNNCYLLELLLSVPLEDRIYDTLYKDIRKHMNPAIDELGINVQNLKHTKKRAVLENLYFAIHSRLPF